MMSGPNRARRGRDEEVSETFSFWERGDDSGAYLTISLKPGSHFIHGPIMWELLLQELHLAIGTYKLSRRSPLLRSAHKQTA